MSYMIQALDSGGQWDEELVGSDTPANTFETEEEAEAIIKELRTWGDDWAARTYLVVERK